MLTAIICSILFSYVVFPFFLLLETCALLLQAEKLFPIEEDFRPIVPRNVDLQSFRCYLFILMTYMLYMS